MQRNHDGENPSGSSDRYALRVLRIDHGTSYVVLMLSAVLKGVLTHWVKDKARYCSGKGTCRPDWHREPAVWKGYVCAAVWNEPTGSYWPCVLEVTEACELLMRGRYKRGQIWQLRRAPKQKGKKNPIDAFYVKTLAEKSIPPEFDMLANVRYLYHDLDVVVDQDNPLPARPMAAPISGESPVAAANADNEDTARARDTFRKMYEERYGRNGKGGEA